MLGIENFTTFMVTALFFIMTPGMDTFFVLNKSIIFGRKSGIAAAIGVNVGVLTHTFFSALGLTVIIGQSEIGYLLVKYAGAIFIVYLGLMKLINTKTLLVNNKENNTTKTSKNDFWSGFFTNSLNPKVALFFLAFFPQYIKTSDIVNPLPFVLLGLTYALIGVVWYVILTLFASEFATSIKNNPQAGLWINKGSGLIFILMGLQIAFG